ncbi:MAG: magnesium transporter CorA family protein [Candidatus Saccharibacteria bacterium]|nr:magnesium transporter CorA family protein [Candidatus Saccharibacteria bacterium]
MLKYYKTNHDTKKLERITNAEADCWIDLVQPTDAEIEKVVQETGVDRDLLVKMRDDDELPRIEVSGNATLVVLDVPSLEDDGDDDDDYVTYPLGFIACENNYVITVSPVETNTLTDFSKGIVNDFRTAKKTRFLIQIITRTAASYIKVLDQVYKSIDAKEDNMQKSTKNEDLIDLLTAEKTLVYFESSLKENRLVLERIKNGNVLPLYEGDQDLLEDAMIENEQALDMAGVYRKILKSISETYSAVINNNQNDIMKFLAGATIVLSIPTIISSFLGMNVEFGIIGDSNMSAVIILAASIILSIIFAIWLKKRGML